LAVCYKEDWFGNLFEDGSLTRGIAASKINDEKFVETNGEEDVLPQQAALAPLLPKLAPILLVLAGGLGCTLAVVKNPHG
jgi:hypothetical protein